MLLGALADGHCWCEGSAEERLCRRNSNADALGISQVAPNRLLACSHEPPPLLFISTFCRSKHKYQNVVQRIQRNIIAFTQEPGTSWA